MAFVMELLRIIKQASLSSSVLNQKSSALCSTPISYHLLKENHFYQAAQSA
jgi:hypothetical protein